jgi:hypothetical protein
MAIRPAGSLLLLALLWALLPEAAFSWNDQGHMMVAAIAYRQLAPATRERAAHLLALNPRYGEWVRGRRASHRDEIAFVKAATWADEIKSDPAYVDDGDRPAGHDAGRNIGYADHLQHRYWHYINLPFSPDQTELQVATAPNVMTQISAFRRALADPGVSDEVKSYDLAWLLHLVGDVHQPLHATSRFTQSEPEGDAGGNRVALCAPPCHKNLHAFWDEIPGKSRKPQTAIRRSRKLPPAEAQLAEIEDVSAWVKESFVLAQQVVYVPRIGTGAGPVRLDAAYRAQARKAARRQIALAGARLARLLNSALTPKVP